MSWITQLFSRRRLYRDLSSDIRSHLEERTDELVQSGLSRKEAAETARREFGNATSLEQSGREVWRWTIIENFFMDVRYGLRVLRKNPGFTAVAVLTLALGIGANTAIFSLIDTVVLKMLPVQNPEQLMVVGVSNEVISKPENYLTNPIWEHVRDQQDVFSGIFAWSATNFDLAQGGESQFVRGLYVSGDYFNTLGVRPAAGRLITTGDDIRGCSGAAVLSYGFWQEHYGGAPSAVGSVINLSNHPFQVIGVAARGFFGAVIGDDFRVAIPVCAEAVIDGKNSVLDRDGTWWLRAMGRPKPGISPEQLKARLRVLGAPIFASIVPKGYGPEAQKSFASQTLLAMPGGKGQSRIRREYTEPLMVLMAVVGLVLLIACSNIASLMLARAAARRGEISIRLAMGASRGRLIRQLLTECLLLSSAGAVLGLLFARWGSALLVRLISSTRNPVYLEMSLNGDVLALTAGTALLTCLLFGALPALRATKISLVPGMKGHGAAESGGRAYARPGKWIVASQVALSFVLLIVAGLFLRSFSNLLTLDAGFDRNNVLIVSADFTNANVRPEQRVNLNQQILERFQSLPGAISASESALTPVSGNNWAENFVSQAGGGPAANGVNAYKNAVSPGYFATLRSSLRAGRDFDERDAADTPAVAIINETMAHALFPNSQSVGQYLRMVDETPGAKTPPIQVVGIVKDTRYMSLREDMSPTIYFPIAQLIGRDRDWANMNPHFEIRTASRPLPLIPAARAAVIGVNKSISLEIHTFEQQVDDSLRQDRLLATLSGFFGGLALFLAMIGLYGVLAYMVTQRHKEIGIRMALGATRGSILGLVMKDVSILLLAGVAAGLGISWWATQLIQNLLFNLNVHDAGTITLAIAALASVALFACFLPARRATKVHPMEALRND
jgi:predicted permease